MGLLLIPKLEGDLMDVGKVVTVNTSSSIIWNAIPCELFGGKGMLEPPMDTEIYYSPQKISFFSSFFFFFFFLTSPFDWMKIGGRFHNLSILYFLRPF